MVFEEFDPQITPEQNEFNDLHEYNASQNAVIERDSQFDVLMVRLSVIWQILVEDAEQNQKFSIASSRVRRQIKDNYSSLDLKRLLFGVKDNHSHSLTQLENKAKERRQVENMLSKLIHNHNLNFNSVNDLESEEIDEELFWLMQEYYRLSSLPDLTDNDTNRMLLILELAQIDPELDEFINQIDAAIAEEAGIIEIDNSSENSTNKKFKQVFIQYLEQRLSIE